MNPSWWMPLPNRNPKPPMPEAKSERVGRKEDDERMAVIRAAFTIECARCHSRDVTITGSKVDCHACGMHAQAQD